MKIIAPSYTMETPLGEYRNIILKTIEAAGRTCYKSEGKITCDSAGPFVKKIAQVHKHESVIEHGSATVRFVIDRGVSHELVRHRLAAYSQESTRYVDYSENSKNGINHCQFILPLWCKDIAPGIVTNVEDHYAYIENTDGLEQGYAINVGTRTWLESMMRIEQDYNELRKIGWAPQQARAVLPNSTKTEVVMTANLREWRHVFKMRTSKAAHPQIREVMVPLLAEFQKHLPELFEDILVEA